MRRLNYHMPVHEFAVRNDFCRNYFICSLPELNHSITSEISRYYKFMHRHMIIIIVDYLPLFQDTQYIVTFTTSSGSIADSQAIWSIICDPDEAPIANVEFTAEAL